MGSLTDRLKAKLGRRPRTTPSTEKAGIEQPTSVTPHFETPNKTNITTPTKTASIPERLWNRAYDHARELDGSVVDAYERILSVRLYQGDKDGYETLQSTKLESQHNEIATDPVKRRAQMRQLVQHGQRRTEKDATAKSGVEENMRTVMVVKESVDKAIHASPEAAIPWVGVCIALELLMNPLTEASSNRQGIAYVISRMDWYWNMATLLLSDNLVDPNAAGLREELEKVITHLYTTLLLFQMKSVCYYHRGRLSVWLRDTVKLDDWGGELSAIKAAEASVQKDSEQYNTSNIRNRLGELAVTARTHNMKLDSIKSAVQEQTLKQESWHDEAANNKCLVDLRATDPHGDKKRIENAKGGLLRDSFLWILENDCFLKWRDDSQKRLLRITADPGMGKTMLLCGIVNELQESLGPRDTLSYFFCQETESDINSATAVLRGLVYLLVKQQPHLIKHVRKRYDEAGGRLFADANTFFVLSDIFKDIVQDSSLGTCYLAIDALDECVRDLPGLLRLITEHTHSASRVKWIVTSRNIPDIDEGLQRPDDNLKLVLPLSPENVSTGVNFFIKQRVKDLAQDKNYDLKTHDAVLEYLETNADSTFLWVALVCQDLQKAKRWNTLTRIREFPPGLKSLYARMLERLSSWQDPSLCKKVLAVAGLVLRPVTIYELIGLVEALGQLADDLDSIRQIVSLCGSFLTMREDTLYFVHQSAKDFLFDEALDEVFPEGTKMAHRAIYSRSLQLLSRDLHRDMYGLGAPGYPAEDVQIPSPDPLRASRYSCSNWLTHLMQSSSRLFGDDDTDLQDGGSLDLFLRTKYLHWLEALSLIQKIPVGVAALGWMRAWVPDRNSSTGLRSFIEDARRFLLSNQVGIQKSPLQTYVGALLFSPRSSMTRQAFSYEEPGWIAVNADLDDHWGACLYTLEGHSLPITSVAFSHDSTRIATASIDSTFRIWNTTSGTCSDISMCHSEPVISAVFSHDSKLFASGSADATVQIFNDRGEHLRTLETRHRIKGVAFSADSTQIASESYDGTIQIWDVHSGACLRTLEGHNIEMRNSIAYSQSCNTLASLAFDKSIRFWDTDGDIPPRTLTNARAGSFIAFSHDLSQIALGPSNTIEIWDSSRDVRLKQLEGHLDIVLEAAFSPDSSQLATAARDQTIKIWNVDSGVCVQTFMTLSAITASLAWSHDSTRLLSGFGDNTTKLWEVGSTTSQAASHQYEGQLYDLGISPVLGLLATGSDSGAVLLWDMNSGERLRSLNGHDEPVRSVAFSHDSVFLGSASDDTSIKIWDLSQDVCVRKLEGHTEEVWSIAFSHDSKLLASTARDRTIRVWDLHSGRCLQSFLDHDHASAFSSAQFSPDSTKIVSSSFHGVIQVWDVESGICEKAIDDHKNRVSSVVLSSDSTQIASKSARRGLKIWDTTHGTLLKQYPNLVNSQLLAFDNTEAVVYTEFGAILLPQSEGLLQATEASDSARPRHRGLGIHYDRDWITYNGEGVVWLPAQHRSFTCRIFGAKVAISTPTGKLEVYDLDVERLEALKALPSTPGSSTSA